MKDDEGPAPKFPKPRGKTMAPEDLNDHDWELLRAWTEAKVPWITRGAFESYTGLEAHVEEVLEWWQGAGRMKLNWLKTVQNRIRQIERKRLERLARAGSEEAGLALREPATWARRYDAKIARSQDLEPTGEGEILRPAGGNVIQLHGRRG